jgi:preprotein translocase subunit SecG
MTFLFYTTIVVFILTCLILIGLVLLQKGRGGGLSGAFGGGGGNTAFGAKTGDVLTWATSIVFGVFVLLAIALNLLANHRQTQQAALTVPVAVPPPPVQPDGRILEPEIETTVPTTAPIAPDAPTAPVAPSTQPTTR